MEETIFESDTTITKTSTDTAETCAKSGSDTDVVNVTTDAVTGIVDTASADSKKPAKKKNSRKAKLTPLPKKVVEFFSDTTLAVTNAPAMPSLDTLTDEISMYINAGDFNLSKAAENYIEAGKRLIQAKAIVGHGNWAKWLDENFSLSQDTAENYMKLAKRFSANSETFRNLSPSKMIAMLALPAGDEKNFIDEQKAEGNDVSKMPTRQLKKAIKECKQKTTTAPADKNTTTEQAPVEVVDSDTKPVTTYQVTIDTQATITGADSPVNVSDFVNIKIPADTYSKLVKLADKLSAPADVILVETLNQLFIKYEDELKD